MDESTANHISKVMEWLDDHVQVFTQPEIVKLSHFDIDWSDFSGSFLLSLDNTALKDKIRFGLEASGKTKFYMPMFHSPLSAPASYAAIELTDQTREAITIALRKTIPRLMGLGRDRATGEEITAYTPVLNRISKDDLENAMRVVEEVYEIIIRVDQ